MHHTLPHLPLKSRKWLATGTTKHTRATLVAPVIVSSSKEWDGQAAATPAVPAATSGFRGDLELAAASSAAWSGIFLRLDLFWQGGHQAARLPHPVFCCQVQHCAQQQA